MTKWSVGVLEYWSIGTKPINPPLLYSMTPVPMRVFFSGLPIKTR